MAFLDPSQTGHEISGTYQVLRCTCEPGTDLAAVHGLDGSGGLLPCPNAETGPEISMTVTTTEEN